MRNRCSGGCINLNSRQMGYENGKKVIRGKSRQDPRAGKLQYTLTGHSLAPHSRILFLLSQAATRRLKIRSQQSIHCEKSERHPCAVLRPVGTEPGRISPFSPSPHHEAGKERPPGCRTTHESETLASYFSRPPSVHVCVHIYI